MGSKDTRVRFCMCITSSWCVLCILLQETVPTEDDLTLSGLYKLLSARSTLVNTKMVLLPWGSIWLTSSVTLLRSASRDPSAAGDSYSLTTPSILWVLPVDLILHLYSGYIYSSVICIGIIQAFHGLLQNGKCVCLTVKGITLNWFYCRHQPTCLYENKLGLVYGLIRNRVRRLLCPPICLLFIIIYALCHYSGLQVDQLGLPMCAEGYSVHFYFEMATYH